jgi:hypothetical protein
VRLKGWITFQVKVGEKLYAHGRRSI